MAFLLLLSGVCLLALPGVARCVGRRLAPPEWARLSAALLTAGGLVVWVAALLLAVPTVLRTAGVPHLAEACERMFGPLAPGGSAAGWSALTLALTLPVLTGVGAARARRDQRRCRIEPCLGEHRPYGPHELVVLPSDELLAFSVAGSPAQIVVSEGLVENLSSRELTAVVRHEAAHLEHRHQSFLLLATALEHGFSVVPFVTRSTRALRVALERWADEAAAGEDRASRSVLRGALLGVTMALVNPSVAAFGGAESVIERLDALAGGVSRPSTLRRAAVYLPAVGISVTVLAALGAWAGDLRALLAMSGSCPT